MSERIGIIGGGIAGLASAFRLSRAGHAVTLFESSDQLGGLGTFFSYKGCQVDRFYHCIMPTDAHLLRLIADLGLSDRLYWKKTFMGMISDGKHYPFNTALDLLRFDATTLTNRVRLGFGSLLLSRLGNDARLDTVPIKTWLSKVFGPSLWNSFWAPMFAAKFGPGAAELPALYLKKRLGREKNVGHRGYVRGGLYGLVQALDQAISEQGGQIFRSANVNSVHQQGDETLVSADNAGERHFDRVISTIPLSLLRRVAADSFDLSALPELQYQGVVNLLIFLNRPLEGYYWTPILNSQTHFDGAVESSTLIDTAHYAGNNAVYLMKYTPRDSDLFRKPDAEIANAWIDDFLRVYKPAGIRRENIVDFRVFRAPFVEPSYPLGYLEHRPRARIGRTRLYLSTTTQVYPFITSWNSSVRVAEETLKAFTNGSQ